MTYQLVIAGDAFLVQDSEIAAVQERILAAVRTGGAFVDLRTDSGLAHVLVTPFSQVLTSAFAVNEGDAASRALDPASLPQFEPDSCIAWGDDAVDDPAGPDL
ncbi:hypothetical protein [Pseudoclavibacter terrae]|uniref:Uncharacterized protein n=1 Tax=Pseudoclavibacter terrae TaxID=1530195 RepID=A0A7J5B3B2_9MICO|nr:hypothetical protein [Pseudoclavibacter terrae]KAB1638506.1 hypothetical protein F8O03_08975 [Pseudoclavibacter terrae]